MKCQKCKKTAVILPALCKDHFIMQFEQKVKDTMRRYKMIMPRDKVCVAVSGGKDSMSLLFLLHKHKYKITAIAVDEGIKGYREHTILHLRKFCRKNKIPLRVVSFKKEKGKTLDMMLKIGGNPCTVCGTARRELLNNASKRFDKIATGHNQDDEAQTVLMNIFSHKTALMAFQKPMSNSSKEYTRRIKPFFLCSEKETLLYALLNEISPPFVECPYRHDSFRNDVREALNDYSVENAKSKKNIVERHLEMVEKMSAIKK